MQSRAASTSLEPSFIELFTPKLVTVFREGYGWRDLRADAVSGLTVAVVALPHVADDAGSRLPYDANQATNRDVMVYRISGAFFFGATARVLTVLERLGAAPRLLVLDFADVPLIDTTAVRRTLNRAGLKPPLVRYSATAAEAAAKPAQ